MNKKYPDLIIPKEISDKWSDYGNSNPIDDIFYLREYPYKYNGLVITRNAFESLRHHPYIRQSLVDLNQITISAQELLEIINDVVTRKGACVKVFQGLEIIEDSYFKPIKLQPYVDSLESVINKIKSTSIALPEDRQEVLIETIPKNNDFADALLMSIATNQGKDPFKHTIDFSNIEKSLTRCWKVYPYINLTKKEVYDTKEKFLVRYQDKIIGWIRYPIYRDIPSNFEWLLSLSGKDFNNIYDRDVRLKLKSGELKLMHKSFTDVDNDSKETIFTAVGEGVNYITLTIFQQNLKHIDNKDRFAVFEYINTYALFTDNDYNTSLIMTDNLELALKDGFKLAKNSNLEQLRIDYKISKDLTHEYLRQFGLCSFSNRIESKQLLVNIEKEFKQPWNNRFYSSDCEYDLLPDKEKISSNPFTIDDLIRGL